MLQRQSRSSYVKYPSSTSVRLRYPTWMPCNLVLPSTLLRRRLDLFLRLSPPRGCPQLNNTFVPMIFMIFDDYADELGVKTFLAGILALLLGLLGFVVSVLALGIVWIIPTMRTRTPYREPIHRQLHGLTLTPSPEPTLPILPPIPPGSKTPSLQRAASFPDLHKAPSFTGQPPVTPRHVSFNVGTPESYNPSLARSVTMNPLLIPPTIQRRWPSATSSFSRCRATQGESAPSSPAVQDESNTTSCHCMSSPTSRNACVHDLPVKCFDEHCECRCGRRNSLGCDEHGAMNLPQVDSFPKGTPSTRSSKTISLRLPSVRRAFSGKHRPASIPPRASVVTNVGTEELSQQQYPTAGYPVSTLSPPPPFPVSGEMYRAKYVNPFRTKKSKIVPKLEASKFSRKSRFSLSGPWSSPKPAGLSPDLALSATSSTSILQKSPSALRRTFTSHFTPLFKSTAISSPSSSACPSPMPSPQLQVSVPKLTGKYSSRSVPRTQPYGPPWNAVMPGQYHDMVNGSLDDVLIKGPNHEYKGVEGRRELRLHPRTFTPTDASEREYPPDNLVDELAQRLSRLTYSRDAIPDVTTEVAREHL